MLWSNYSIKCREKDWNFYLSESFSTVIIIDLSVGITTASYTELIRVTHVVRMWRSVNAKNLVPKRKMPFGKGWSPVTGKWYQMGRSG